MNYQTGDFCFGFTVVRVRETEEIGGRMVELTHDKTGAQVVWIDNGETNKLFSITFKTLPEDSTGVFHILEHSTLCGSRKYPVREPFVELMKSSMHTFLNAMTGGDLTTYPVSSRNAQDYLNLASVYMDAVFAPRILEDPNIFYQEGCHIEQHDGKLSFKGVVFNEMKGAMSGEDRVAEQKLMSMIFEENSYGFNSGGDPEAIPNLTYEQFIDTYRRFYHPSNARVFLDGSVPMDDTLRLLDEYFSRYERAETLPEIVEVAPKNREDTVYYEAAPEDNLAEKEHLYLGKIAGSWRDRVRNLAANVLCDVLAGSNEAPVKRAVLSAGLAQDISMYVDDQMAQPVLIIAVKGVRDGRFDDVRRVIRETAGDLCGRGIGRSALEASINRMEFSMREPQEPQGLIRLFSMLSWFYGADPLTGLLKDDAFKALRAMLDNGGFESLANDLLVSEDGLNVLKALPSKTLGEEKRAKENARLQAIADSWTQKDWEDNRLLNENLERWQKTPDAPEAVAALPMLQLDQVSDKPVFMETGSSEACGARVLRHFANCHGIVHVSLYFALTDASLEEISRMHILKQLFGKLPTARHDALSLQEAIKNDVGRMEFDFVCAAKKFQNKTATPYFVARLSALEDKLPIAEKLLVEILTETDFDQTDRIREIVMQRELEVSQESVMAGHRIGLYCALSHGSAKAAVNEALMGYTTVQSVHDFARNFDDRVKEFSALAKRLQSQTICRARLTASVTGAGETDLTALISAFREGTPVEAERAYRSPLPMRMGIRIPAQVSFAEQGASLESLGREYDARYRVATNILSLSYLWNVVRVQGGAYGTGIITGNDANIATYSFRDPTPARSLEANRGMEAFVREMAEGAEPLDKYVISAIAATEPLVSPREEGNQTDILYLSGFTYEDKLLSRRQMLSMTKADLADFAPVIRDFAEKGAVCVVGFADALSEINDLTLFDM